MTHLDPKDLADPAVLAAIQAMTDLCAKRGFDTESRAHARVVRPELLAAYQKQHRVKRAHGAACALRILGKRCQAYGLRRDGRDSVHECWPLATDHATLWARDGKIVRATSEPYGLAQGAIRSIAEWCKAYGLSFRIGAASPYFHGSSLLVEFATEDEMWWSGRTPDTAPARSTIPAPVSVAEAVGC